jgi:hypothetical protein
MKQFFQLYQTLIVALICISANTIQAQDIFINKDTTVNNNWILPKGAILHFGSKGHINGTGTIKGGIIDAALTQWLFETSLEVQPEATFGKDFSACWFGAGKVSDNYLPLQKSIQTVVNNPQNLHHLFLPKGVYNYSQPLIIAQVYKGKYVGTSIHFYGESNFWDTETGSVLQYTGTDRFALGLQLNKGSEIDHLQIRGQFQAPNGSDVNYFRTAFENFKDTKGKCAENYSGMVIDFDGSKNEGGSTGIFVHDMQVSNFSIDYSISPNSKTFNADILLFERIKCGDAQIGFATGQAQEKGNVIRGIYSWGNIHTLFKCGYLGKGQAGNYVIDGGNIAGRCIQLFDINQQSWYSSSINHIYAESLYRIGKFSTQIPLPISNCTFHFVLPKQVGQRVLIQADNNQVQFNNCIFRYYGTREAIKTIGKAIFNNCYFGGTQEKQ